MGSVDMDPLATPRTNMTMSHDCIPFSEYFRVLATMMLMPCSGTVTMTTGSTLVAAPTVAPETDAFVVSRISTSPEAPLPAKISLPGSVKLFALVRIPVAEETLLADPDSPIPPVVIRYFHLGTPPEGSRMANGPPSPGNPVYERRNQTCFFSAHDFLPFRIACFLVVRPRASAPASRAPPCLVKTRIVSHNMMRTC